MATTATKPHMTIDLSWQQHSVIKIVAAEPSGCHVDAVCCGAFRHARRSLFALARKKLIYRSTRPTDKIQPSKSPQISQKPLR